MKKTEHYLLYQNLVKIFLWKNNTIIFLDAENSFYSNLFNNENTWIGIKKFQTDNKFVAIDNSPLRFTPWMLSEPNFNGNSAASISSKESAEWEDRSIYDEAYVVCSFVIPG